jgi:hypothetical protein
MARNGLKIGLVQAFLQDYSHVVLLLDGEAKRDTDILRVLVTACASLSHRPVVIGIGPLDCDHEAMRAMAHSGGMVYLDCDVSGSMDPETLWGAAEPALDFSLAANSDWAAFQHPA